MDGVNIHFWAAVVYGVLALCALLRAKYFEWFGAFCASILITSTLGTKLVTGRWVIPTKRGYIGDSNTSETWLVIFENLFRLPHLYLTVASVFFFLKHWRKEGKMWVSDGQHPVLALFAVSNVLMTLVFAAFAAVLFYQFPSRSSVFGLPVLLEMYALAPLYWFAMQAVLMAVWYLHRVKIAGDQAHRFSSSQINGGIALAWLMMVAVGLWLVISVRL